MIVNVPTCLHAGWIGPYHRNQSVKGMGKDMIMNTISGVMGSLEMWSHFVLKLVSGSFLNLPGG